jgi:diguanylate cyclase (GGDEF)-like protein
MKLKAPGPIVIFPLATRKLTPAIPKKLPFLLSILSLVLLLQFGAAANAQPGSYTVTGQKADIYIGPSMHSWDFSLAQPDPKGVLRAAGINPLTISELRESTSAESRWHTLLLHNSDAYARNMLLELRFTSLTDVEVFTFRHGQLQERHRAGIRIPFSTRPIEYRYPLFPVHIPAGESTFVVLVYNLNGGMLANQLSDHAYLWDESLFFYSARTSELIYWFFFGAFSIMIVYHAAGALIARERIYFFYAGFCATYLLMQMSLSGFGFQLFWPNLPALNAIILMSSLTLMATLLAHFALAFLDSGERFSGLSKAIWAITLLSFAVILPAFSYASRDHPLVSTVSILAILVIVFAFLLGALGLALLEWWRGNPRGRQFTSAWGLFLIAQSSGIVVWMGIFRSGVNQAFLSMSGALISLSLISIYMANRASKTLVKHELATALIEINSELAIEVQERKLAEERAWKLAHHDSLTGLPTLRLARERLQQAVALGQRSASKTAVLFIDLDGFKAVNDTYGHEAGDQLLEKMATRMTACVRESDTVARVGGDEFLIIQTGILDTSATRAVAKKLLRALSESYVINGQMITVSASIGIALCPDHGTNMSELVKLADTAMYAIKKSGKNSYGFVDSVDADNIALVAL